MTYVSVTDVFTHPIGYQWFLLAALTLFTGSFTIKVPTLLATLSVSETFVCACVLMYGPAAGALTVALDAFIMSIRRAPSRVAFNMAAPTLSVWVAAQLYYYVAGATPGLIDYSSLQPVLLPLMTFSTVYFLINSLLIAAAIAFSAGQPIFSIWRRHFLWLSLNYYGGASAAALIAAYTSDIDIGVIGILLPLLLISYLTFRTAMGRMEDANRHVAQLNSLYLSTVQTLAMAIDAKDQVTHGHVRRVQTYALALARAIGVYDESELKAIEAAALLHDTGKLAVPEHILKKPGRLTKHEFDTMKLHASVGADILSEIPFPFPVVPIVRHHHENWDGSGYPTGLSKSDIPIGARILSVVDCFDALTSDRPYRTSLPIEDALRILSERKGSMYDPCVVDKFIEIENTIELPNDLDPRRSSGTPGSQKEDARDIRVKGSRELDLAELTTIGALVQTLQRANSPDVLFNGIVESSRTITAAAMSALFVATPYGRYQCVRASGFDAAAIERSTISAGERLTGWVAATQHTVHNSDPDLDLGPLKDRLTLSYRSILAAAVVVDTAAIAVLSVYAVPEHAFSGSHRAALEHFLQALAPTLNQWRRQGGLLVSLPTPSA